MSCLEPTSPTLSLHARYRAGLKRHKLAAARLDKLDDDHEAAPAAYEAADAEYDAAFNEIEDLRDEYWAAPARSRRDWIIKLTILQQRRELEHPGASTDVEELVDQIMAFTKRQRRRT